MGYVGTHAQALGVSQQLHVLDHKYFLPLLLVDSASFGNFPKDSSMWYLGGGEGKCAEVKPESPSCLLSSADRDMRSLL